MRAGESGISISGGNLYMFNNSFFLFNNFFICGDLSLTWGSAYYSILVLTPTYLLLYFDFLVPAAGFNFDFDSVFGFSTGAFARISMESSSSSKLLPSLSADLVALLFVLLIKLLILFIAVRSGETASASSFLVLAYLFAFLPWAPFYFLKFTDSLPVFRSILVA